MVDRALIISLFVVVWAIGCVFVQFVGVPDGLNGLTESYRIFTITDDLVESFTEISHVFEGPVV